MRTLYAAFAGVWHNKCVGGSYALHTYSKDDTWTPNDIDVFVSTNTEEDFIRTFQQFEQNTEATLTKRRLNEYNPFMKTKYQYPSPQGVDDDWGWSEGFSHLIRETRTYKIPQCALPIQIISLNATMPENPNTSPHRGRDIIGPHRDVPPEAILDVIADVPSCVSFKLQEHQGSVIKLFHVPENARRAIETKVITEDMNPNICKCRMEKYMKRGYKYELSETFKFKMWGQKEKP